MNYCESLVTEILKLTAKGDVTFFEAAAVLCEQHDVDIDEFVKSLDKDLIARLKMSAIESRNVRRSALTRKRDVNLLNDL